MKARRSASQVLFGFLPEQTVDLEGGVWKVKNWRNPIERVAVDVRKLSREIRRHAREWRDAGLDGGYVHDLERGADLKVLTLDREAGVYVEPFPKLWHCKRCRRISSDFGATCPCGAPRGTGKGQLPFVGYCSQCGAIKQPWIPTCPQHGERRVNWPGTASAREIVFDCPQCNRPIQKGLGMPPCHCGHGNITYAVHRASSVYTARSVVIVNPPSPERIREIAEAGGPPRALAWVVNGMKQGGVSAAPTTTESLRRRLVAEGLSAEQIELMLKALGTPAKDKGYISEITLPSAEDAEEQAVSIALAMSEARTTIEELKVGTTSSELKSLYSERYPESLRLAGLESIDLVDRFPVLTGMFGYTRGDTAPGASRLVPFKDRRGYQIYADLTETEALFVRLAPSRVAEWLRQNGHAVRASAGDTDSRIAILESVTGTDPASIAASDALFKLVHTYCHRFIRLTAVYGGIERNALSELVLHLHLGFFVYAGARGDFVLGGLQAIFESELDALANAFFKDEHRCPLDPGCEHGGGACMACVHLGEPSCRHFNSDLGRSVLTGEHGYLTARR